MPQLLHAALSAAFFWDAAPIGPSPPSIMADGTLIID
jgi:hypothetical protein